MAPGKIELLEAVRATDSISQAARELRIAYTYAWFLLESLKLTFKKPITRASVGDKGGGGVRLTELGEEIIETYRTLEKDIQHIADVRLKHLAVLAFRRSDLPAPLHTSLTRYRGGIRADSAIS